MDIKEATIRCLELDIKKLETTDVNSFFEGEKEKRISSLETMIEKVRNGEQINRYYSDTHMASVMENFKLRRWIDRVEVGRRWSQKFTLYTDNGTWTHLNISIDIESEIVTLSKDGFMTNLPIALEDIDWLFAGPDTFYHQ